MKYIIGVDVGATNTRIALANQKGDILDKVRFRTPNKGDRLTIANTIRKTIKEKYGKYIDKVVGIGIGTIGPVDLKKGMVINAPNNPIRTFDLREPLMEWLGKPVYVANDCVAAVWGEYLFGAGKGHQNIVYITLSTGIGGGVIVNGVLLLGKQGNAHEIGHMVIDYNSKFKCGCGGYGHWEAYASGANIPRFAKYLLETENIPEEFKKTDLYKLIMNNEATTEKIFEYAKKGDGLALFIVNKVSQANIVGVANTINVYDPEVVTIGGSVALYNEELIIKPIVENVVKHLVTTPPKIMKTPLGDDVVLKGAIALIVNTPSTLKEFQE